jgi:aminodeoxychorismate synthase component I
VRLQVARLKGWVNPSDAFVIMNQQDEHAFWLDRNTHKEEPFSVIGSAGSVIRLGDEAFAWAGDYLARLREITEIPEDLDVPFSFRPGLVGYLGYELNQEAKAQAHTSVYPKAQFLIVDRAVVFDHANREMYFIGIFETQESFDAWHYAALLRLTLLGGEKASYLGSKPEPKVIVLKPRHTDEEYLAKISKAKAFIQRGDVYQICLTNQLVMEHEADPLKTFLGLRENNPAPYSTYLKLGGLEIVSSSPESFLNVSASGSVSTKPIKGTRPRSTDEVEDLALAEELRNNEKEQAENLMIVDLMRNDLGKVCDPSSIVVEKLFDIESYSSVHQLVSTVTGTLQPGQSATKALAALFPGGSMTGAPKIRAVEILEDLEEGSRGIYSGAIGYLGIDGSADFAMTIRTLVFEGKWVTLGVGGGITSDSDVLAELEETKLKAKVLLNALGGVKWSS